MKSLVSAKIAQASQILRELDIDAWLVFVRETSMQPDPVLPLVVGAEAVWQSCFLYTRRGEAIALVGNYDAETFRGSGFAHVDSYVHGVGADLVALLSRLDPKSIAINYSVDDVAADGLTHGMYLLLTQYLKGTPYEHRLISSAPVVARLRSRKLPEEVARLETAARIANEIWAQLAAEVAPGMTERQIAGRIDTIIEGRGTKPSFPTIVNAGDKSSPGHGGPTEARLEAGDLLHVDFGVVFEDYCSDIQRLAYVKHEGESRGPRELVEAFETVRDIITACARQCRSGVQGHEIDAVARRVLCDRGFPEYQHALGHQLGRNAHDGGAVIGPAWERYGRTPFIALEPGNVFTLELGIELPGIGYVGLEEDVCLETRGTRFLSPRQMELVVV